MDKNIKDFRLFRLRSTRSIIKSGYRLYLDNFRKIFRSTWLVAIVYALASGILMNILTTLLPNYFISMMVSAYAQDGAEGNPTMNLHLLFVGIALVFTIVSALLAAFGFTLLAEHRDTESMSGATKWYGKLDKGILVKTLATWLSMLVFCALYFAIGNIANIYGQQYLSRIAVMALVGIWTVLFFVILPPLILWMVKYIMSAKGKTKEKQHLLRYWGSSIAVSLVTAIVTYMLTLLTELPAFVLFSANIVSQAGALQGDPTGMPDYMSWLNIVVFSLAGFIQAYIYLSSLFPFYYLYGSTEAQEKERKELPSAPADL